MYILNSSVFFFFMLQLSSFSRQTICSFNFTLILKIKFKKAHKHEKIINKNLRCTPIKINQFSKKISKKIFFVFSKACKRFYFGEKEKLLVETITIGEWITKSNSRSSQRPDRNGRANIYDRRDENKHRGGMACAQIFSYSCPRVHYRSHRGGISDPSSKFAGGINSLVRERERVTSLVAVMCVSKALRSLASN